MYCFMKQSMNYSKEKKGYKKTIICGFLSLVNPTCISEVMEYLFKKTSSLKFTFLLTLLALTIFVLARQHVVYGWAFITTKDYTENMKQTINGQINGEGSGTFFPLVQIAAINCAMTSFEKDGKNGSGYCPENLKSLGLIPSIARINDSFYHAPPANLALWIKDTATTLGLIPKSAYAQQGIGFSGMQPLLDIWKAFRNLAYALLSLAIVVVGFMIMFRKKIDPQTVASIQEALPRIIIALILITFSYAIVGLFIDLMYVIIFVIYQIFTASGIISMETISKLQSIRISIFGIPISTQGRPLQQVILNGDIREVFATVFPAGMNDLFTIGSQILNDGQNPINAIIFGTIGGLLLGVILNILLLILMIRLFVMFLAAYLQIVFQLIFGPLYILSDVLPGSNNTSTWIKNLIANLSVYVVSATVFLLAIAFHSRTGYFSGQIYEYNSTYGKELWIPPYTSIMPTFSSVSALFTIGVLFLLPSIVKQFKEGIKSTGGMNPASGIGGGLSLAYNSALQIGLVAANFFRRGERGAGRGGGEQH